MFGNYLQTLIRFEQIWAGTAADDDEIGLQVNLCCKKAEKRTPAWSKMLNFSWLCIAEVEQTLFWLWLILSFWFILKCFHLHFVFDIFLF